MYWTRKMLQEPQTKPLRCDTKVIHCKSNDTKMIHLQAIKTTYFVLLLHNKKIAQTLVNTGFKPHIKE